MYSILKLKKGVLQLKAYVSVAGPDILALGASETAKDILKVSSNNFLIQFIIISYFIFPNTANERISRVQKISRNHNTRCKWS